MSELVQLLDGGIQKKTLHEINNRLRASEMFSAGVCNLECSYCYIPKNDMMNEYHNTILKHLDNGEFIEVLKSVYGKEMTHLALWGTEPTLIMHKVSAHLDKFIKEFPHLSAISFSTNLVAHAHRITDMIETLSTVLPEGRTVDIDIQVSIDGPAWVTDIGRGEGVTDKILKNIDILFNNLKKIKTDKVRAKFRVKATVDMDTVRKMNTDTNLITEWFMFFDTLHGNVINHCKDVNGIRVAYATGFGEPTLVVPGKYTSYDGKDLAEFYANLTIFKDTIPFVHVKPITLNSYTHRLLAMLNELDIYMKEPAAATCSGYDTQAGVNIEGNVFPCHRYFLFDNDEYVKSVLATDIDEWGVSNFKKGIVDNIRRYLITNINTSSEREHARYAHIGRSYHDFLQFKISNTITMIIEMARVGQASSIYLENFELTRLLAIYINSKMACNVENYLNTGTLNLTPSSIIRILANGAFEEIFKEAVDILNRRNSNA